MSGIRLARLPSIPTSHNLPPMVTYGSVPFSRRDHVRHSSRSYAASASQEVQEEPQHAHHASADQSSQAEPPATSEASPADSLLRQGTALPLSLPATPYNVKLPKSLRTSSPKHPCALYSDSDHSVLDGQTSVLIQDKQPNPRRGSFRTWLHRII